MNIENIENIINKQLSSDMSINQKLWLKRYQGNQVEILKDYTKDSINATKLVCYELASLILNENINISFSNDSVAEYVENIVETDTFIVNLQHKIEQMFALGGLGAEVISTENGIEFNFIRADRVIPLSYTANKDIKDIAFIIEEKIVEIDKKRYILKLVRTHTGTLEAYKISNYAFISERKEKGLGKRIELSQFYDLEDEIIFEDLLSPLFAYVRPNVANNIDLDSPLGVSVLANSMSTLRAIDMKYNSFNYEFLIGKKRLIVPDAWLRKDNGKQMTFPADQDYFIALRQDVDEPAIIDVDINLRVDEHIQAINQDFDILASQVGFNSGAFTLQESGIKTATEVISNNSKTFKTKKSHEVLITHFIETLLKGSVSLGVALQLFKISKDEFRKLDIVIDYDDSIVEDNNAELDRVIKMLNNELITKKQAIMLVNKVTEEEAEEMLKEIEEENAIMVPSMVDLVGRDE